MSRALFTALLLLPALALAAPSAEEQGLEAVRRFALLVGASDGGPSRVRLRYAASDARALGRVLGELGGVPAEELLLLLEPDRKALEDGLARLRERVAAVKGSGGRTEAILYYSGHSDEEGLLLGQERFSYRELRQALNTLPADVRIAILDSCASGSLARTKGGVKRPAFLVDASSSVRGHAILTSSSEDEVSQESERLGGSYFTHNLVSGLRGAADLSGDGRVTLSEAYQFAFDETRSRTEKTRAGAQHPSYDIELAGSGDLVLTELPVSRGSGEGAVPGHFGNVRLHVEAFGSDINLANVGLKVGSRSVYSVFTAGLGTREGKRHWTLGLGLGGHVPLGRWFVDVDVVGSNLHDDSEGGASHRLLAQLRLLAGWQLAPRFALIAGPTFNVLLSLDERPVGARFSPFAGDGQGRREMWPGLQLGLRL